AVANKYHQHANRYLWYDARLFYQYNARRRAVYRKHQTRAVDDFLEIYCRKKILDERLAKLALGERIRDDKAELSVRSEQAKAHFKKRTRRAEITCEKHEANTRDKARASSSYSR